MSPVRAAAIRTLFLRMRSHAAAGGVITVYMIGTAWAFTPHRLIAIWAVVAITAQLLRQALRWVFYRQQPEDAALGGWARLYAANAALIGMAWGASFFLFAHPTQPVTVALTLCCLYSIASGSTPSHAYYPPSLYALVVPVFAAVLIRLLATGQFGYVLLGLASALYALTMVAFCRAQARTLDEGFQIRFENQALVEALTVQKAEAEEARRKAELASLAKSQFLAAASHDLRQPLYALSLFSASLGALKLDEEGARVVANIQDSVAVMESLFTGLLDISKLEAGVVRPKLTSVSVDALFDRLSQYFRPVALERGLDLRFRSDGEWVTSDEALLEQVLSNLVSNALRCTRVGGVLVAARRKEGKVRLEVWDTGIGIGERDRERVFEEFVQLENPERDRRKGLGLGLAIASRSAALIGSRVALASRPGLGSRFAVEQLTASAPRNIIADGAASGRGIAPLPRDETLPLLIVEDDRDVRHALSDLLNHWGARHEAVADAEEALLRVEGGTRYGLVLSDYRLAGSMNGLELLMAIDERHPQPAPASALITGDFDAALIAAAHLRDIPLLMKPLKPQDLQTLLGIGAR
jgi:signal transduction histidine kinase/CheY-like chemotaxis protein